MCPDGYVYNIEVERFHTYTANGLVVHNCHHATAASYRRVIAHFQQNPELHVLGVTATSDRADGSGLGKVFESLAFDYELPDIIADGYLVPIHQRSVVVEGLDFSRVHTRGGDFDATELEAAMMYEKPLHGSVAAALEVSCNLETGSLETLRDDPERAAKLRAMLGGKAPRKSLIFTTSVAHSERVAEILNRWLPGSASHIDGAMDPDRRRAILASFAAGEVRYLCNCMIATEGFDEPSVELVVMMRPTKSRPLYAQMVGRGTRPAEAVAHALGELDTAEARRDLIAGSVKPFCEILDFVGNAGRHKLVSTADLLGRDYAPQVIERAKKKAEETGVDMLSALKESKQELERKAREDEEKAKKREEERERRRQAEAARRAGLVGTARYRLEQVDSGDRFSPNVRRGAAANCSHIPADTLKVLRDHYVKEHIIAGLTAEKAGKAAQWVLAQDRRAKAAGTKLCTYNQARMLFKRGFTMEQLSHMTRDEASMQMNAIAQREHWKGGSR